MANRVAEERGALLGHEVGYTIRFDDCSDPQATRIKVLLLLNVIHLLTYVISVNQSICLFVPVFLSF